MIVARFIQQPYDRRKRALSYDSWLEKDELVTGIEVAVGPVTVPPFVVSAMVVDADGRGFAFTAGDGLKDTTYIIEFRVTTTLQRREDEVEIEVVEEG